ncbi:hypothetical protein ACJX0J_038684 [Zea mays]
MTFVQVSVFSFLYMVPHVIYHVPYIILFTMIISMSYCFDFNKNNIFLKIIREFMLLLYRLLAYKRQHMIDDKFKLTWIILVYKTNDISFCVYRCVSYNILSHAGLHMNNIFFIISLMLHVSKMNVCGWKWDGMSWQEGTHPYIGT